MRVVFMGTPAFAVPSLRALAAVHEVVAVYTAPDRPAGRGLRVQSSPVADAARDLGIRLEQPATFRDPGAVRVLEGFAPDIVAVAAYGSILPPAALSAARLEPLNVHASLLPRWRGAAPIERAILAGDEVTGVSIMRMEAGLDTGPYAMQVAVPVDDADATELRTVLADMGAAALSAVIEQLGRGTAVWATQDESRVTYAAKISAADVMLSPDLRVIEALRRVRASGPNAPSRMLLDGRALVVESLGSSDVAADAGGVVVDRSGVHLGLADGSVTLHRVRPAGKGSMDGAAFARGAHLPADARWGAVT